MGCIGFLVYRFNAVFNVSKTRAAVVAILCGLAGLAFLIAIPSVPDSGYTFGVFSMACWVYALIYGCIWFVKFNRDKQIVERAKVTQTQQPVQMEQPMNNQGSRRLFVPPPIDR